MANILGKIFGTIIQPVAGVVNKQTERKQARETAKATIELARQQGVDQLKLTDAQWEAISTHGLGETWKDEYLTVVVSAPIPIALLGALYAGFTGDSTILGSVETAFQSLNVLGIDMGFLVTAVVTAGVGLKVWRKA